ncbi:hypothetical protein DFAR_3550004 [Desulfarculales bacterium]
MVTALFHVHTTANDGWAAFLEIARLATRGGGRGVLLAQSRSPFPRRTIDFRSGAESPARPHPAGWTG